MVGVKKNVPEILKTEYRNQRSSRFLCENRLDEIKNPNETPLQWIPEGQDFTGPLFCNKSVLR